MPTNEEIGTTLLIDVQKLVECPICCESLAQPLSLSCGHSFCKSCLDRVRIASSLSHDANNSVTVVKCPECRQDTRLPEAGLPVNYCLRDVVSLLSDATALRANAKMKENRREEGECLLKCSICKAGLMNDVYISCCDCSPEDEKARQMCPVCCLVNHNGHKIEAKFEESGIVTVSQTDSFAHIPYQCDITSEDVDTASNEIGQEPRRNSRNGHNFTAVNDHNCSVSISETRNCLKRTGSVASRLPRHNSTACYDDEANACICLICCILFVLIILITALLLMTAA